MANDKQLLIDIGNTRTKYCFYQRGELQSTHSCENQKLSVQWFTTHWQQATNIVFACVAQQDLANSLCDWARGNNIPCRQVTSPEQAFGVTNGYDNHEQLGVDRWLAVLGAHKLYPNKASLIIDAGTATTLDVLNRHGEHQGGWILAGIDTLFTSIQVKTANVTGQQADIEQLTFGRNTNDNLANAAWASTLGMVYQAVELIKAKGESSIQLIFTGGNGEKLLTLMADKECPLCYQASYQSMLVFHGLSCYLANLE